jgi:hypothetical protein
MPYEIHPSLVTPPDNTVLWRYLDLAKFMDMLERRVLWFARADKFEDPLEGTYTDAELDHLRSLPSIPTPSGTARIGDSYLRGTKMMRSTNFISCWRAGADESMAMWDLYRKGSGVIAIKSTIGRLKEAVGHYGKPVYVGEVKYVDWKAAPWDNNLLAMCVRKVLAYKHESEIRAMIWGFDQSNAKSPLVKPGQDQTWENALENFAEGTPPGLEVPFDFQQLITEVWVGPREKQWIYILVKQIMKRYGLPQQVVASCLLQPRI